MREPRPRCEGSRTREVRWRVWRHAKQAWRYKLARSPGEGKGHASIGLSRVGESRDEERVCLEGVRAQKQLRVGGVFGGDGSIGQTSRLEGRRPCGRMTEAEHVHQLVLHDGAVSQL